MEWMETFRETGSGDVVHLMIVRFGTIFVVEVERADGSSFFLPARCNSAEEAREYINHNFPARSKS